MCSDAGNTSEIHFSTQDNHDDDDDDDHDDDGDDVDDVGGDGDAVFTLDFNLGTMQRRRDIQTKLIAATLNLKKKLTRADNGRNNYYYL